MSYLNYRTKLIKASLSWEETIRTTPSITCVISELDAANYLGIPFEDYCNQMANISSVNSGFDFEYNNKNYQVKATRESGRKGSKITRLPSIKTNDWDVIIYIRYNAMYEIQEAYLIEKEAFLRIMKTTEFKVSKITLKIFKESFTEYQLTNI